MRIRRSFGAEIYEMRHSARMTQRALAKCSGISEGYLSEIENDRVIPPPLPVCERILDALGVDSDARQRIVAAASATRQMRGSRVARSAPPHVSEVVTDLLRLGPTLSRTDADRIKTLLKEFQM